MGHSSQHLQFILDLGGCGAHVLFGVERIRSALSSGVESEVVDERASDQLRHGLSLVAQLPTVGEQRAFLQTLPDAAHSRVCRFYFTLLGEETCLVESLVH
jgi:hypothetical protein